MSGGFSFGAKMPAPTFGSGSITFGTSATGATPQLGLGGAAAPQPANTGFQFGGAPAAANSFGATAAAPTAANTGGFKFGAPAAAAPTPNTGFGFGASQPTSTSTALGFGAPAATPAVSLGFGASAGSTGLSFGAPASTNLGFGAKTATVAPFGAPACTASTGLSFGTPASTGLSFGTPASSAPNTGLSFGGPSLNTPATTLNFGTTPAASTGGFGGFGTNTTTAAPGATGLSFGAAAQSVAAPGGLSFGKPVATAAPTFGVSQSVAATGLTLGPPVPTSVLNFGGTTGGGLTLGLGTAPAATTGGLSFGLGPTTTVSTGLSFGLGGGAPTSTSLTLGPPPSTTQQQNVGLGGIATTTAAQLRSGATIAAPKEIPPKEQPLPNEILQTVESFKNHIKNQKLYSSEIARCSVKEFRKVESDIDMLNKLLIEVERELQKNRSLAEKLKYDSAKGLQHVEMAQRTQETPPGLQYENTAPLKYFSDLVDHFEKEMQSLKVQIESTDKYVRNFGQPSNLTSQDLALGMRRLHDTFVALAGRLQSVHTQVESQKELYLTMRKHCFNDNTNPFESNKENETVNVTLKEKTYTPPKVASGPTPFTNTANITLTNIPSQPPPAYPGTSQLTTQQPGFGNTANALGTTLGNQSTLNSYNFQLQKPPTGNKRGKLNQLLF